MKLPTYEEKVERSEEEIKAGNFSRNLGVFFRPERIENRRVNGTSADFIVSPEMIERAEECEFNRAFYDEKYGDPVEIKEGEATSSDELTKDEE